MYSFLLAAEEGPSLPAYSICSVWIERLFAVSIPSSQAPSPAGVQGRLSRWAPTAASSSRGSQRTAEISSVEFRAELTCLDFNMRTPSPPQPRPEKTWPTLPASPSFVGLMESLLADWRAGTVPYTVHRTVVLAPRPGLRATSCGWRGGAGWTVPADCQVFAHQMSLPARV